MNEREPVDAGRVTLDPPWTSLWVVESVPSTNAALVDAPAGSVLVAEFQSAGRGRLDRTWSSPPRAGLTFSVALRPMAPARRWGWLALMAGLALSEAVPGSTLKWPNDLLLPAGKAAGILATLSEDRVVVGMGVNVSTPAADLPAGGTSLLLAGLPTDRTALLQAVLDNWSRWYLAWSATGGDADGCGLRAAYRDRCATLGQRVTVSGAAPVSGTATDVDPDGRLLVDGVPVAAGDVRHVRPVAPGGQ